MNLKNCRQVSSIVVIYYFLKIKTGNYAVCMKKEVKDNIFLNSFQCLKTKVRARKEKIGNFMLGDEKGRKGRKIKGIPLLNARKRVYLYKKVKI